MVTTKGTDQLFLIAEKLSNDFNLFPDTAKLAGDPYTSLDGVLSNERINYEIEHLKKLDIDAYIEKTVSPSGEKSRPGARAILKKLGLRIIREFDQGPLYAVEAEMDFNGTWRRLGFICQDRSHSNGVWLPDHHNFAIKVLREFTTYHIPVVTMVDTPGADANEEANANNQAHSISSLIAEMSNVGIPTLGIIIGRGYSGGAIPLATTNMILSVRDGVFSTIQPEGLASIARKYNLSWQECAKYVGVSSFELYSQGYIDGIIDYSPTEKGDTLWNFSKAIITGILAIEASCKNFVFNNKYIFEHSRRSIFRYLQPTDEQKKLQDVSMLHLGKTPTEQNSVFGVTNRYLRYLHLRRKISSMRVENYGRLADSEVPKGELEDRTEKERKSAFYKWLQDPDKILYDDNLNKSWKTFVSRREDRFEEPGRFTRLFLGDPQKKFEKSLEDLKFHYGFYLYNLWKSDAHSNFLSLIVFLKDYKEQIHILQNKDIKDPNGLARFILNGETPLALYLNEKVSYESEKVLALFLAGKASRESAQSSLASEFNVLFHKELIYKEEFSAEIELPEELKKQASSNSDAVSISLNRKILEVAFPDFVEKFVEGSSNPDVKSLTILNVISDEDVRNGFIEECENFLVFDSIYNNIVANLVSVAKEANSYKVISKESVRGLLDQALEIATSEVVDKQHGENANDKIVEKLRNQLYEWLTHFVNHASSSVYISTVEEWKKLAFPRLSDTLLVVISHLFKEIMPEFFKSEKEGKYYEGRINPKSIGPKKDFWNRISIAYNDLLIQDLLGNVKKKRLNPVSAFIDKFFLDFEFHRDNNLISSDPVKFPGFRLAIEQALSKGITPCGVVTGIGRFKSDKIRHRVGVVISNLDFQAGAFDMASAEKVCKLLVDCAIRRLPVICFISSGGMQTKEGAGSLFSMSIVNDRITRFIRDNDLPVIVFGFGDCTGGAQASFVTHPCVQTYYFSGTNMPFAGQIVVPSYLPSTATLSNYLSRKDGAMKGLVKNPFAPDIDSQLKEIDPNIPVPKETVEDVFVRIMKGIFSSDDEESGSRVDNRSLLKKVQRVLIHARGCTAVKLIRKAQERDIQIVLVQSDPDMDSVSADMIGENDRLVCIGGNTSDESYLNAMSVIKIAEHEEVDSLHPGIGFLSENAQFAEYCRNHSVNFIGPSVYSMEMMGNKSNAINTALKLNIPVVPGSHGVLTGSDLAASVADRISYPVLIKAVHGGGGKGIQVVEKPELIHELFHQLSAEAKSAFGNGDVYLEKYITSLRHIEVQLLRDSHGNAKILGLRDCSVQRNNQKLIEESGSTMLPVELEEKAYRYTEAIANEIDYIGAGTVEFIFDLQANSIYFMEMNTRLQVEHPVTEAVSGVDIVSRQFAIASGDSISDIEVKKNGYAMEVRVNAEKLKISENGAIKFLPNPGDVVDYIMPEEDYIEIISTIDKGKRVSPYYDSMIVQIICHGEDREDTVNKLLNYLDRVTIKGICTNISLIKSILKDEIFRKGIYDTGYLPRFLKRVDAKSLEREIEENAGLSEQKLDIDALRIIESNELKVISPSTGIFYSTPSPKEPDFIRVGDQIGTGKTLCLIEAMKLFTAVALDTFNTETGEIYSSQEKFEITRINKTNGQQVNAGDLLFVIKPLGADSVKTKAEAVQ